MDDYSEPEVFRNFINFEDPELMRVAADIAEEQSCIKVAERLRKYAQWVEEDHHMAQIRTAYSFFTFEETLQTVPLRIVESTLSNPLSKWKGNSSS